MMMMASLRWPSVICFRWQFQFLTACPGKKSQFSRNANLSRFWPGILDLSRHWQTLPIYSHMLRHRWPNISSEFTCICEKKLLPARALPWTPLGNSHSQAPKSDPGSSHLQHSPSTACAFGTRPGLQGPNYGHLSWGGPLVRNTVKLVALSLGEMSQSGGTDPNDLPTQQQYDSGQSPSAVYNWLPSYSSAWSCQLVLRWLSWWQAVELGKGCYLPSGVGYFRSITPGNCQSGAFFVPI